MLFFVKLENVENLPCLRGYGKLDSIFGFPICILKSGDLVHPPPECRENGPGRFSYRYSLS